MGLNQLFLGELEQEAASTRRMLALVPADKGEYKPHEKSMSLGKLAVHVAEMYSWIGMTIRTEVLDFAVYKYDPAPFTNAKELLARMDGYLADGKGALLATNDAELAKMWTMRNGEHVFFSIPRSAALRTFVFNHIVHHRAQVGVYLRLLNIPIPGMYGPSADDGPPA